MITVNGIRVRPDIFPDKTSQVWKLPDLSNKYNECNVTWTFENEAELIHLAQLKQLLDLEFNHIKLILPYLPYARQDKQVSNKSTFALNTFAMILNSLKFSEVHIYDPHSDEAKILINKVFVISPSNEINDALVKTQAISCFPDKGAAVRYSKMIGQFTTVTCEKIRDQLTGDITGFKTEDRIMPNMDYLIIDDICDGGRTFIEAAKVLHAGGANNVHLYVSHGIFSKGLEILRNAGIKRIFTQYGEINEELSTVNATM